MTYLCDMLQAKYGTEETIKIGKIELPSNESWHQRDLGSDDVLALESTPTSRLPIAGPGTPPAR